MKVRIEIDTRTFVRFWLVMIGFAFAILAIYNARVALIMVGAALFLALALNAPVSLISRHLPGKSRVGATAVAYVMVLAALAAVVFLVIPPIAEQTSKLIESAPEMVDSASQQWRAFGDFATKYNLQDQVNQAVTSIKQSTQDLAIDFGKNVLAGLGSFFSFLFSMFIVLVLSFLMLIEGPEWLKRLWASYTDEEKMKDHKNLLEKMYTVVNGYVGGLLTVSMLGALSAGLVVFTLSLTVPGVPSNLAFPTIAIVFLFSLIPMFGATISGVLVALLLAINSISAAIIYTVFFLVYQQIEANFISPTIQSKKLELSPLLILGSVTVGLYVFGIAGGIISIPIAGCIKVLLEDYLERSDRRRKEKSRPLAKLVKKLQPKD